MAAPKEKPQVSETSNGSARPQSPEMKPQRATPAPQTQAVESKAGHRHSGKDSAGP